MTKTIKEWLESAPEEWRELALQYMDDRYAHLKESTLHSALIVGCNWPPNADGERLEAIYDELKSKWLATQED
jgi:hypothetical protein